MSGGDLAEAHEPQGNEDVVDPDENEGGFGPQRLHLTQGWKQPSRHAAEDVAGQCRHEAEPDHAKQPTQDPY